MVGFIPQPEQKRDTNFDRGDRVGYQSRLRVIVRLMITAGKYAILPEYFCMAVHDEVPL
jgi:hypothetical protein